MVQTKDSKQYKFVCVLFLMSHAFYCCPTRQNQYDKICNTKYIFPGHHDQFDEYVNYVPHKLHIDEESDDKETGPTCSG